MGDQLRLREDAVDWRSVEGEVLALDLGSSEYVALNRSGATLWEALAAGTTEQELADMLVAEHGADPERARADVKEFLRMLRERDFLAS